MFRKISPDSTVNDDGFSVELVDKMPPSAHTYWAKYTEGDLVVVVEIEGGGNGFTVYTETLALVSLQEKVIFTPDRRDQIIKNIDEALTFLGINHILEN